MDRATLMLAALVIIVVAVASFSSGSVRQGPLANPPNPNAEFGVVKERTSFFSLPGSDGPAPKTSPSPPPPTQPQPLSKFLTISQGTARTREPNKEYVDISYSSSAQNPVNVSDWTISNSRGEDYRLGRATNLPGVSDTQNIDSILLQKGTVLHIVTGQSPLGISFRANRCTGYFRQFHSFTPPLSGSCPAPNREPGQDSFSDTCYQYFRSLSSCIIPRNLPLNLDNECRDYIAKTVNYNGCLQNHRYDQDFYSKEWWIYLNRPTQIWSDVRDSIILRDESGNAVATYTYQ